MIGLDNGLNRVNDIPEKCTDYTVLISPFWSTAIAHAFRLGLQNLAFFFGFAVDTVERDSLQGLV